MNGYKEYLELAVSLSRGAGLIQKEHLGRLKRIELKGVANLVTDVDLECERYVMEGIARAFPDHNILSEESGRSDGSSSACTWIIDPLDGTTNYAHGYLRFCVSVALAVEGVVQVGVVYDPMMDELYHSVRGEGAFLNGESLRVSDVSDLEDALLATGFAYDKGKRLARDLDIYREILPRAQSVRRDGSAALDLCYVAAGRFDGFWELNLNSWDIAAGSLIIEEAGGRWSDIRGKAVPLSHPEFLGTNGRIHDTIVDLIKHL